MSKVDFTLFPVEKIVDILQESTKNFTEVMSVEMVKKFGRHPFIILISCLLSLRARDVTTLPIALKLFEKVSTPEEILLLERSFLEKLFYSIGFYKKKAKVVQEVSSYLITHYNGQVPNTQKELLKIPGVGIKTANLVLAEGFGVPAICVDVHVHRLSNRFRIVSTRTPEQTEKALTAALPKKYWIIWNRLLVKWGQNVCKHRANCVCLEKEAARLQLV